MGGPEVQFLAGTRWIKFPDEALRQGQKRSGLPCISASYAYESVRLLRRIDHLRDDDMTRHDTTRHSTAQHSTTQHNTVQYNTIQHNTLQHKPIHTDAVWYHCPCHDVHCIIKHLQVSWSWASRVGKQLHPICMQSLWDAHVCVQYASPAPSISVSVHSYSVR